MTRDEALRVLGVGGVRSTDQLVAAFRAAAKRTHPDRGGRVDDFRLVVEAYDLLQSELLDASDRSRDEPLDERSDHELRQSRPAYWDARNHHYVVAIQRGYVQEHAVALSCVHEDGHCVLLHVPRGQPLPWFTEHHQRSYAVVYGRWSYTPPRLRVSLNQATRRSR